MNNLNDFIVNVYELFSCFLYQEALDISIIIRTFAVYNTTKAKLSSIKSKTKY